MKEFKHYSKVYHEKNMFDILANRTREKLENLSCLKTDIKPNTAQNPQKLTKMGYTRKLPKDSVLCFCDSRLMCAVDVLSIVACFSDFAIQFILFIFFKKTTMSFKL